MNFVHVTISALVWLKIAGEVYLKGSAGVTWLSHAQLESLRKCRVCVCLLRVTLLLQLVTAGDERKTRSLVVFTVRAVRAGHAIVVVSGQSTFIK